MATRRGLMVGAVISTAILIGCNSGAPATDAPPASAGSSGEPAASASAGLLPTPEVTTIRIGGSAQEPAQFTPQLAVMLGTFERYGLDVQFFPFEGESNTAAALLAGAIDVAATGGGTSLNSLLTDTPLRHFTLQKVKVIDGLFCGDDIKTAEDLKGKQVAISALGGVPHASLMLSLQALGLQTTDVEPVTVGAQSARLAALQSGAVACAPIGMDRAEELSGLGFSPLVDLSTTGLEYPSTGYTTKASWLEANPNTALVLTAATLDAHNSMWADPETAAAKWAEFAQIDLADAQTAITVDVPAQLNRSMAWKDEAFEFAQQVIAVVNPDINTVDPTEAFDRSYLERLAEIGFYEEIGNPERP